MTFNGKMRDNKYLQHLDTQLKELRKELESDVAKYRDSGYLIKRKCNE